MIGARVLDRLRRAAEVRAKLIVVGLHLSDQVGHSFNELLGYKTAAEALGLAHRIIVPRTADPRLAALLSADPLLDPLPRTRDIDAEQVVGQLVEFADMRGNLESLWAAIETQDPRATDILLFSCGHPMLISGVGWWLALRSPARRPSVFFRIVGNEIIDMTTGRYNGAAVLFRMACSELRALPGQERVFLLVESSAVARMMTRVCCRRTFLTPMPKHLGAAAKGASAEPAAPTVYMHLNEKTGRLVHDIAEIIRRVTSAEPMVRFIVKARGLSREARTLLESGIASFAEILPAEQDTADYLTNFSRCSVVLLAYEQQAYRSIASGVFVEAASFGKPVVVPGGTWMAQQIIAGRGVGRIFDEPKTESIVAALLEALTASERLGAAARSLAPRLRNENSCQRFIEQMLMLIRQMPDMEPRYQLGEEIDFGDPRDSRCFMRRGWGDTESWGVWTVEPLAELALRLGSEADRGLILKACVRPFLTRTHRRIGVRVSVAEREIAQWTFRFDAPEAIEPRWCEASLPPRGDKYRGGALEILFTVDSPASPLAEGVSTDGRTLGMAFYKLSLHAAA
jgi:hypothetical protein